MQGDARVVQLPDDHGHVFPAAGRCQQQLMHLERHAHILAVRVVEQPACKGTQSLDILFGQGGRVTVVDKLRQQSAQRADPEYTVQKPLPVCTPSHQPLLSKSVVRFETIIQYTVFFGRNQLIFADF